MPALEIKNLSKIYPNKLKALESVNLEINEADFFALLGPNGAGKSTTIGVLCGLVKKTSGCVKLFGNDIDTASTAAKSCIGIVPQEVNFSQFETPLDIVVNQAGYYGIKRSIALKRAEKYLHQLGLTDKCQQPARNLSGGMKRRLMIARALIHQPRMLVLDEPSAGVDVELRRSMWDFLIDINQRGVTIMLTTHYLEEAESLCKNIAIINHGKIIENTSMKKLLANLNEQTFVLDLIKPINNLPTSASFKARLIDKFTIEIEIARKNSINDVFDFFSLHNIQISSLRNKTNRLEKLFLDLLKQN